MRNRRKAFTLIEALIVVIIMAVLAATIIPQFSTSTKDAKMSNLKFNLHTDAVAVGDVQRAALGSLSAGRGQRRLQESIDAKDRSEHDPRPEPTEPAVRTSWATFRSIPSIASTSVAILQGDTRADRPDREPPTAGSIIRSTAGSIRTTSNTSRAPAVSAIGTETSASGLAWWRLLPYEGPFVPSGARGPFVYFRSAALPTPLAGNP